MHTRRSRHRLEGGTGMTAADPPSHIGVASWLWNAIGCHHCPSVSRETVPLVASYVILIAIIAAIIIRPISVGFIKFVVPWRSAFRWYIRDCGEKPLLKPFLFCFVFLFFVFGFYVMFIIFFLCCLKHLFKYFFFPQDGDRIYVVQSLLGKLVAQYLLGKLNKRWILFKVFTINR